MDSGILAQTIILIIIFNHSGEGSVIQERQECCTAARIISVVTIFIAGHVRIIIDLFFLLLSNTHWLIDCNYFPDVQSVNLPVVSWLIATILCTSRESDTTKNEVHNMEKLGISYMCRLGLPLGGSMWAVSVQGSEPVRMRLKIYIEKSQNKMS